MSYFEFYSQNIDRTNETRVSTIRQNVPQHQKYKNKRKANKNEVLGSMDNIIGTCMSMCPEDEFKMRTKAKMVHILEAVDGTMMLVKSYSRSAADSLVAVPRLLRPYIVLRDTVQYLVLKITQREASAGVIYDFVTDRLRAVRQDMTVQRLSAKECVSLLEPMIRFHVYFGYKLCEYPINVYDPVLNKKLLLECLKWYLSCCDSMDQAQAVELASEISQLNLNHNHKTDDVKQSILGDRNDIRCDQVLMESLYILCNLDDVHPLYRYWNMSKILKSNATIKLAYRIAVANLRGNYVQVCKQMDNLCPLTYCAVCLHLPTLQRHALRVISAAYSSKQLLVPLRAARRWLRCDSDAAAARLCAHYGLIVEGDSLRLNRGDFRTDVAMPQATRLLLPEKNLDLSVPHIFTYVSTDYAYAG